MDRKTGKRVVEVGDLSYLSDRDHPYNWFQRHYHHHRLRRALKRAEKVIVVRYYFVPKERITIKD